MIRLDLEPPYHYGFIESRITINGLSFDHRLLVDTGAYGLVLATSRAALYGHRLLARAPLIPGAGAAGAMGFHTLRADELELLTSQWRSAGPTTVYFPDPPADYRSIGCDGLIGTADLQRLGAQLRLNYATGAGGIRL